MKKIEITKEELYHLYIEQCLSALKIANLFGYKRENKICTLLKKYGIEKSKKDKIEQAKIQRVKTNLERYGVEYCGQNEKMKEKMKKTNLEKYGVENPSYCKEIKEKIGKKNKLNAKERIIKTKQTCLEKYGVESYTKTLEFKKRFKQTCLEKYGVECPLQRKDVIEKTHTNKTIDKQMKTKRINKTFNSSKIEDKIYKLLCEKYGEVKRQYKSNDYPFACDFYIPVIDTYIEYQGFWTHGKEPYIGIDKQKEKLKLWESKNTPQYVKAINDWTNRDVLKRDIAKKNNLNWLEFFNIEQVEEWLNKI